MKTIWKYEIAINLNQMYEMPKGAKILSAQSQFDGGVTIWVLVDPQAEKVQRMFSVYGTGHPIDDRVKDYIGTVVTYNGQLVWHVFEIIEW